MNEINVNGGLVDLERLSNASQIKGWMFKEELEWLSRVASQCEKIIEVGSWYGRSTKAIAHKNCKLICVDTWEGTKNTGTDLEIKTFGLGYIFETFKTNLCNEINKGIVEPIKKSSDEAYNIIAERGELYDMIFIDGNHFHPFIDNDISNYKNLVRKGGILCGHDYNPGAFPAVVEAVQTQLNNDFKLGPQLIWYKII